MLALLRSQRAGKVRQYIAYKNYACPLANQWLSNVLLTPRHMLKVLSTLLRYGLKPPVPEATEAPVKEVRPEQVKVHITGTSRRKALVLKQAGTTACAEEVDLPVFDANRR